MASIESIPDECSDNSGLVAFEVSLEANKAWYL